MLSIGLWRWYVNVTVTNLDITHRPLFYLEDNVSETESCPSIQVKCIQLGPTLVDRARLYLRNVESSDLCIEPNW
jgi:hypothetical protein